MLPPRWRNGCGARFQISTFVAKTFGIKFDLQVPPEVARQLDGTS
jgi:hypothetical protein